MPELIAIPAAEFAARTGRLRDYLEERGLGGAVLFDRTYIHYFTGFAFIPTGRPIAFALNRSGDRALFVPRLEVEHARMATGLERVDHYQEYPQRPHPMEVLKATVDDLGIAGSFGGDSDGYPPIFGYRGPALSALTGGTCVPIGAFIESLMAIKSPAEIRLLRESCAWGNLAHHLLQRYTAPGKREAEVSLRAGAEATLAMLDALGDRYQAQDGFFSGAFAGYRGIGRDASMPHALAGNAAFEEGDVLISGAGAPMWGYYSELERTMIVGRPTDRQRRMFEHMTAAQQVAFDAIRPGVRCCDVDRAVRAYYERNDLMSCWKHHTGRSIGLRFYEGPFLDVEDDTELRPGMVFAVEPGLYAPDLGGFRHSDTVVVTEHGNEPLTAYPRDLESLTV